MAAEEVSRTISSFEGWDYAAIVLIIFVSTLAATAGVGGGAMFTPILIFFMSFSTHEATGLGQSLMFGGTFGGFLLNNFKRHPCADRPVVDVKQLLYLGSFQMGGALVGVVLNRIFAAFTLVILLMLVILYNLHKTIVRGIRLWKSEKEKSLHALRDFSRDKEECVLRSESRPPEVSQEALSNAQDSVGEGSVRREVSVELIVGSERKEEIIRGSSDGCERDLAFPDTPSTAVTVADASTSSFRHQTYEQSAAPVEASEVAPHALPFLEDSSKKEAEEVESAHTVLALRMHQALEHRMSNPEQNVAAYTSSEGLCNDNPVAPLQYSLPSGSVSSHLPHPHRFYHPSRPSSSPPPSGDLHPSFPTARDSSYASCISNQTATEAAILPEALLPSDSTTTYGTTRKEGRAGETVSPLETEVPSSSYRRQKYFYRLLFKRELKPTYFLELERSNSFGLWLSLVCIFLINCGLTVLRGGEDLAINVFEYCGVAYWLVYVASILILSVCGCFFAYYYYIYTKEKVLVGFPFVQGDFIPNVKDVMTLGSQAFGAGILAGTLGIGGGMLLGPLMLTRGFPPQVVASLNCALVTITSFSAALLFVLSGQAPWNFALLLAGVCFVGASFGKYLLDSFIEKTGRISLLVFILSGMMVLSFLCIFGVGIHDLTRFGYGPFFNNVCNGPVR